MKAVIDACRKIVNLATEVRNNPDIGIMTADNIYQKLFQIKADIEAFRHTITERRATVYTRPPTGKERSHQRCCSECHCRGIVYGYNFCPNCGARFEEADNG